MSRSTYTRINVETQRRYGGEHDGQYLITCDVMLPCRRESACDVFTDRPDPYPQAHAICDDMGSLVLVQPWH